MIQNFRLLTLNICREICEFLQIANGVENEFDLIPFSEAEGIESFKMVQISNDVVDKDSEQEIVLDEELVDIPVVSEEVICEDPETQKEEEEEEEEEDNSSNSIFTRKKSLV